MRTFNPTHLWLSQLAYLCLFGLTCTLVEGLKKTIEQYACYNTVLDLRCHDDEMLLFESARYGRNDTLVAARCHSHYQRNCDVDAHFTLNRLCSGKSTCALVVNTELFGDPCGYEEFLNVAYTCIQVATLHSSCQAPESPPLFDHGYLASPNYPMKYYMDAECTWHLAVQSRQSIRLTLYDFELDVKRGGTCYDYLLIKTGDGEYFKDCGGMGKQVVDVDASSATVIFHSGQSGLTQRGFLIYFQAIGPGCPDLLLMGNGSVEYHMEGKNLSADVTCYPGFYMAGSDVTSRSLACVGSAWNDSVQPCIATPTFVTSEVPSTTAVLTSRQHDIATTAPIVGIILGVVSALLLIALLLVLSLYLHRRRMNAERKLDEMRVVFNNLTENAINDGSLQCVMADVRSTPIANNHHHRGRTPTGSGRNKKKQNCTEDELQGCNLLSTPADDDDYDADKDSIILKQVASDDYARLSIRKGGRYGYAKARSKESHLDSGYEWDETELTSVTPNIPPVPPRRHRQQQRARSSVWDPSPEKAVYTLQPRLPASFNRKLLTQSAPDLIHLVDNSNFIINPYDRLPVVTNRCGGNGGNGGSGSNGGGGNGGGGHISRSSTLAAMSGHRTVQKQRSRSSSRANVRA